MTGEDAHHSAAVRVPSERHEQGLCELGTPMGLSRGSGGKVSAGCRGRGIPRQLQEGWRQQGACPSAWLGEEKRRSDGEAWIKLGWVGLDWIGMDWIGLHSTVLHSDTTQHWIHSHSTRLHSTTPRSTGSAHTAPRRGWGSSLEAQPVGRGAGKCAPRCSTLPPADELIR